MKKSRTMIVDDDERFLQELEESPTLAGCDVVTFSDGIEARNSAQPVNPEVIMLDLDMPGKSGFVTSLESSRLQKTARIPIIAMTGYCTGQMHAALISICGAREFLIEPFDAGRAIDKIERVLKRAKRYQ